ARVLEGHNRDAAAEDALRQALSINVHQPEAVQHFIALRQRQCKWPVIDGWDGVDDAALWRGISPLSLANLLDDPMLQLARSYRYAIDTIPAAFRTQSVDKKSRGSRLRIGYLSSDLREHAVGFAMTEVIELHDRSTCEVFAYYCGIARSDPTQQRIRRAADAWVDINGMSDDAVADRISSDGVDILVDLNGYTKDARTRIFSFRPAPIAVNWFGFPGSMGTPYHHYIIADDVIVPPGHEHYFSEKVLRLGCYQPNDRSRTIGNAPTRNMEGLPESGVVYCCLNGSQKFTAQIVDAWMEILRRVEPSCLWLLSSGSDEADARLRNYASCHGVDPGRLVFASKKPNPDHLARYALADIFLDTFPYGAHTTASDALWMGVPILTISGGSFASRVCASVLSAAGTPELIMPSVDAYVDAAVQLGKSPSRIDVLKQKLAAGRDTCLLFDTPKLVASLECLYREMWSDYEAGRLPVPDLTNLDLYQEIGIEIALSGGVSGPGQDLDQRYLEGLARHDLNRPVPRDSRLWDGRAERGCLR
ncbi:MAG: glycosyl transferase, partial [Proteobacteria bacterium]|nr:glycosyl transferase [Pseudomonadota bacterium]